MPTQQRVSLFALWNREEDFISTANLSEEKEEEWINPRFQTKQPEGTQASPLNPTHSPLPWKKKKTSPHIKEKHLSLQGPSSHVTLNRFMFTKCQMSPEEQLQNYGVWWGICWVDPRPGSGYNHISNLCSDPTLCPGGFCASYLNHETFSNPSIQHTAAVRGNYTWKTRHTVHKHLMQWFIWAGTGLQGILWAKLNRKCFVTCR